jgi:uncharacterized membrane protein HdeD (DUF308 family)
MNYNRSLRNLYLTRTLMQLIWAFVVIRTAVTNPALAGVLLIAYPLWDVACSLFDLNQSRRANLQDGRMMKLANVGIGICVAAGIALTVFSHPQNAVLIFGAWAFTAGLLQLMVGLKNRKTLGGQWAMILSGAQSTAAGVAFILGGIHDKFHVKDLGGYAVFGAIYFLIAAVLLTRKLRPSADVNAGTFRGRIA